MTKKSFNYKLLKKSIAFSLAFSLVLFGKSDVLLAHTDSLFKAPARGFTSWQPAGSWEHALISGNGTIGALVFGQPHQETVILSHAELYLPLNAPMQPINQGSRLQEIRQLLLDGKNEEAAKIPVDQRNKEDFTIGRDPFIPAFNLKIEHEASNINRYQRSVNFETGETRVNWQDGLGLFDRKLVVSRADSVIVLSIKSSGKINCKLNFESVTMEWSQWPIVGKAVGERRANAEEQWLTYRSDFTNKYPGGLQGYEGVGRLVLKGGTSKVQGSRLVIADADEVLLLIKIKPTYNYAQSQVERIKAELLAKRPDYTELLKKHVTIHGSIFNRVKLKLGDDSELHKLHSEELLLASKNKVSNALIERVFDAGRYNVLSATGTNPPNLQGLWSGTWTAPWNSDFTHDGNLAAAIAANLSGNMPELMDAFFRYHEKFMPQYKENAQRLFASRGIHIPAHTSNNALDTDFGEVWCLSLWTGAAGWTSHFFFDYYQYTGDKSFLKTRAYPFMKEAALFYEDFLTEDKHGKLVFNPSYSPENNPGNNSSQAAINATMDVMIAKQLLRNCIKTAKILGDNSKIALWENMLEKMPGYQIAKDGSLREWLWDNMEENHQHRHSSQLYALYDEASPDIVNSPGLLRAANKTIDEKLKFRVAEGGGEMAFGLVQLGLAAAHIGEEEKAVQLVNWLSSKYWSAGMGSFHNVGELFNTDISGGLPALIIEMLVYSQPGTVSVLPALPAEWPKGKIEGVLLRGGLELKELTWENKTLRIVLKSAQKQRVTVKFPSTMQVVSGVPVKRLSSGSVEVQLPANRNISLDVLIN